MMNKARVVTGTLTDERTLVLDEPLGEDKPLRVRVTIEPLAEAKQNKFETVMAEIRQRQLARGHVPPTKSEVDEYLRAERESWNRD